MIEFILIAEKKLINQLNKVKFCCINFWLENQKA